MINTWREPDLPGLKFSWMIELPHGVLFDCIGSWSYPPQINQPRIPANSVHRSSYLPTTTVNNRQQQSTTSPHPLPIFFNNLWKNGAIIIKIIAAGQKTMFSFRNKRRLMKKSVNLNEYGPFFIIFPLPVMLKFTVHITAVHLFTCVAKAVTSRRSRELEASL